MRPAAWQMDGKQLKQLDKQIIKYWLHFIYIKHENQRSCTKQFDKQTKN